MDEVAQYKEYADECRGLAATAKKPEHKKQLLEMATAWDTVARQKKCELAKRDLGEPSVAARQAHRGAHPIRTGDQSQER
jgi:hypothetical protein